MPTTGARGHRPIRMEIGLNAIRSFRRLNYTTWHALAEFVDNSTQSYATHRDELDPVLATSGEKFTVEIDYDGRSGGALTIRDNAMGMSETELRRALRIGDPPPPPKWRSQ